VQQIEIAAERRFAQACAGMVQQFVGQRVGQKG
jgi:hypothetical protein